ncbi:MAG: RbsD/FucU family protein [Firmicutes bacterium]|nr:RbsD/FucU family protein [Bacillota bacterium]
MLKCAITHPELLRALAAAGHGSNIVIADGNFPADIGVPERCAKVFLNYRPDAPKVPEVLEAVLKMINVEAAMAPVRDDMEDVPVFPEFRALLPEGIKLKKIKRWDFRAACMSPETGLLIQTGDIRPYACIVLTVGVRTE